LLRDDLLAGDFEEAGESQVLFLHPGLSVPMATPKVPLQARRMTREWLRGAIKAPATQMDPLEIIRSGYLAHCWIPRLMAEHWLAKHRLQSLLSFFTPRKEKRVAAKIRDEKAAARALAAQFRQNEHLTREHAKAWLDQQGFKLTGNGFRFRVWRDARREAGLLQLAPAGRKKSVR
jgi:hypothetical protein